MIHVPDVNLVRYLPESLPVAEVEASIPTAGVRCAEFSRFSPNVMTIQNVAMDGCTDVTLRILVDNRGEVIKMYGPACVNYKVNHVPLAVSAMQSAAVYAQAGAAARSNMALRFNVTMRQRTLLDVYHHDGEAAMVAWVDRMNIDDATKQSIKDSVTELADQDQAGGMIPTKMDLLGSEVLTTFRHDSKLSGIFETSRVLPAVSAGATIAAAETITAPEGHVAVILGIGVDAESIRDLSLFSDSFIQIDRLDGNQTNLCRMDMAAMPGETAGVVGDYMRMYVPTLEQKLYVKLTSTTGLAAGQVVKVLYGIKRASAANRLTWGNFGQSTLPSVNDRVVNLNDKYALMANKLAGRM